MSRRTRLLLGLLALAALVVVGVDVLRQTRQTPPLLPTLPTGSFSIEAPETQRGLDKTPLVYQAEFIAQLTEALRPSLVLATPAIGMPSAGVVLARGRGVLVSATSGSARWTLQTLDGRVVRATVRGRDLVHGVLLLRPGEPFDAAGVRLADPEPDEVGPFLAIQPRDGTASTRVITAPGSAWQLGARLRQDGVPPGSTVVDLDGELVSFIAPGVDEAQPLDVGLLGEILDALGDRRAHRHPWIGADLQTIDGALRRLFPAGRIVVVHVDPGSPAANAGLRPGDVLQGVRVGDATLDRAEAVANALPTAASLTLRRAPPQANAVEVKVADLQVPRPFLPEGGGVGVTQGIGVAVRVLPGSRAATAGLQSGDIVEMIDKQPVATAAALARTLADPGQHLLTVCREETRRFIVVAGPTRVDGAKPANDPEDEP
ncbi:MAG: PDZ domain-containing protein [Vicinamibacteraceae bacterium]